jgi:hypothetical protein
MQEAVTMRTLTALFDSRAEAERTVEMLVQQYGLSRDRVQVHAAGRDNVTAGTMDRRSEDHHGFLASRELGLPEEQRAAYAEGLRRGGILVAVQAEEDQVERVFDTFRRHDTVDVAARSQEWRREGWTGEAGSAPSSARGGDAVRGPATERDPER